MIWEMGPRVDTTYVQNCTYVFRSGTFAHHNEDGGITTANFANANAPRKAKRHASVGILRAEDIPYI